MEVDIQWTRDGEDVMVTMDRGTYVLLRDHLVDCENAHLHGLYPLGEKLDERYRPE